MGKTKLIGNELGGHPLAVAPLPNAFATHAFARLINTELKPGERPLSRRHPHGMAGRGTSKGDRAGMRLCLTEAGRRQNARLYGLCPDRPMGPRKCDTPV